jgi:hypothetical protein
MEFMRRFSDLKPSVRLAMLSWASTYLMVSSEGSHLAELPAQVCAAVHKLVLDFDDKVRLSACSTLCQLAVHNLDAVPMEYLQVQTICELLLVPCELLLLVCVNYYL